MFALTAFYKILGEMTSNHCSLKEEIFVGPDTGVTKCLYVLQCSLDFADVLVLEDALLQ